MRYMIAHMITGEGGEYIHRLSDVLASHYKLRPVTPTIMPHLTVKAPFDALSTDLMDIERAVDRFSRTLTPHTYTLKGFGSFHDRVIYMQVQGGEEILESINRFKDELRTLPWLEFKDHEKETVLHATLCYPHTGEQAQDILTRLTERGGKEFHCTFDALAILKKNEGKWEVYRTYKVGGEVSALDNVIV